MKAFHTFSLLLLAALPLIAQQPPCLFDAGLAGKSKAVQAAEIQIRKALTGSPLVQRSLANHTKVIPVVVHVIHSGGTENISDAQIQSQITVMNEDFRKMAGTNGFGNGVDTQIEFCLAKKDPNGKCTDGIVRINSPLSNHQTYQRSLLSQLSFWDNNRYLNIYVVKNINNGGGIAGYASFPGGPDDEDGIVVRHNYFGKTGTAAGTLGRTNTHEAGHWLGLYHTFHNSCGTDTCADGDLVCDTPPVNLPNYNCPLAANTCSNDNLPDQVRNYMDYTSDNCKNMFSNGQKNRMQGVLNTLRDTIWQPWNLDSTGCDSGYVSGNCKVIPNFACLSKTICVGNTIVFYNSSQNNPTAYQWSFAGGTPSVSSVANPTVTYNSTGSFQVKLIATNVNGTDSIIKNNYIVVTNPPVGQALPYFEGFEGGVFPPPGMTIENPDNGITWQRDTVAVAFQGTVSAKINNLININYGQSDALVLPRFDFTTFSLTPYLSFKWAYAKSDPVYSDELLVLASSNCGVTWTQVFYVTGNAMITAPTQTAPYIPNQSTIWKTASINLSAYANLQNVQIKIVNVTDGGNNLYIDNINLGTLPVALEESSSPAAFSVYPNPFQTQVSLTHTLKAGKLLELELHDVCGRMIWERKQTSNSNKTMIDLPEDLSEGLYFLKIRSGEASSTFRLIKVSAR